MANFLPLKQYIFQLLDKMIDTHHLVGPFLDAGGGIGDTALHLARRGWSGLMVDSSPEAVAQAAVALAPYPVRAETKSILEVQEKFNTIVMLTVIEHVKNDLELLRHLRGCFMPDQHNQYLILSMPVNPKTEWRWDDDYYGHYRRYEKAAWQKQLLECGFKTVEFWDYTFPVFWAMRRLYTRCLPPKKPDSATKEINTAASSMHSAWEMGGVSSVITRLPIWPLVNAAQKPFRNGPHGYESIILVKAIHVEG
jgi:SAM-dependent methyltransferase